MFVLCYSSGDSKYSVIYFRVKREDQCKELKAELAKLGQKYFTMDINLKC